MLEDKGNFKIIFAIKFNNPSIFTKIPIDCRISIFNQKCQVSLPLSTGIVLNIHHLTLKQKLKIEFIDHKTQFILAQQMVPISPLVFHQEEVEILDIFNVNLEKKNIPLKGSYYIIFINEFNKIKISSSSYNETPQFVSPKNAYQPEQFFQFEQQEIYKPKPLDPLEFSLGHSLQENPTVKSKSVKKSITPSKSRKRTDLNLSDLVQNIEKKVNIPSVQDSIDFIATESARKSNSKQVSHRNQLSFSKLPQRQSKEKQFLNERKNTSFTLYSKPQRKNKETESDKKTPTQMKKKKENQNLLLNDSQFKNENNKLKSSYQHTANLSSKNILISANKEQQKTNFVQVRKSLN